MSGYRFNKVPEPANNGEPVIDGGNATTNYLVVFNNGTASNTGNTNPVRLDFGKAT